MRKIHSKMLLIAALIIAVAFITVPVGSVAAKTLKIAIIAPSASNDLAFTQSIVDGINAVKKDRDLEVAITDGTFVVEDAAAAIRDYAKKGYDLVIAHGSQYGGSLKEIAPATNASTAASLAPFMAAASRAVLPSLNLALTSAPLAISNSTMPL